MISKSHMPTMRDGGNIGLVMGFQVILTWVVADLLAIDIPQEVVVAFGAFFGYFAARYLRY